VELRQNLRGLEIVRRNHSHWKRLENRPTAQTEANMCSIYGLLGYLHYGTARRYLAGLSEDKRHEWLMRPCINAFDIMIKPKYEHFARPFYKPEERKGLSLPKRFIQAMKAKNLGKIDTKLVEKKEDKWYRSRQEFENDV